jgi:hypothetical protein
MLVGASVLGLAAIAIAPRLHAGGGDEGVDILPSMGPSSGIDGGKARPQRFLAIHGNRVSLDTNDHVQLTGFLTGPHTNADVFMGLPGDEPGFGQTTLDILAKGRLGRIHYSDVVQHGGVMQPLFVHLSGRFEVKDFDPDDGETLKIVSFRCKPSAEVVILGKRTTKEGGIVQSFGTIDTWQITRRAAGSVDLLAMHDEIYEAFGGSGYDVAVGLVTTTAHGIDEVWAAWAVDDRRVVLDVEVISPTTR